MQLILGTQYLYLGLVNLCKITCKSLASNRVSSIFHISINGHWLPVTLCRFTLLYASLLVLISAFVFGFSCSQASSSSETDSLKFSVYSQVQCFIYSCYCIPAINVFSKFAANGKSPNGWEDDEAEELLLSRRK